MKRIALFIGTNLAIMAMILAITQLLGVDRYLTANGINYSALFVYSLVVGFTGAGISLLLSKKIAKWQMKLHLIENPQNEQERWLFNTVAQLAQRAGLPMPELGIYEGEPNAFATGPSRSNALVGVSTGLLSSMSREEVEAVLAHEIAHIANGDMVTMTLLQGVMNTFVVFLSRVISYFVESFFRKEDEDSSPSFITPVLTIVLDIVFGLLAAMVVAAFSRHREYRADAGAAALMGQSHSMKKALQRLETLSNPAPLQGNLATLGFSGGMGQWFSSHPPLSSRIARLG